MAQIVTARRKGVNCLAEGWVDSLAEIPFRWVNYLAEGWVDSLAEIPLKWVVCLAVDTSRRMGRSRIGEVWRLRTPCSPLYVTRHTGQAASDLI
jgi:hypothetical protein